MSFNVINPANKSILKSYEYHSEATVFEMAEISSSAFRKWRHKAVKERCELMRNLVTVLKNNNEKYARLITDEMGKSYQESRGEVEKCGWMTEVYVENSEKWLKNEEVKADGVEHYISYEPLGPVLSIMPWNFPFWQVLRFAVPTILAGNVSILKHSNQVPACALAIEEAFLEAGFPKGIFQTILTTHDVTEKLMVDDRIQGISFTGSTSAGEHIGKIAGGALKKVVLELGGSDPFVVLDDADIDDAAKAAALGRFMNNGQSCIAAKRFIVAESVAEEFSKKLVKEISTKKMGDPSHCDLGPLVNSKALDEISDQVQDAVKLGGKILHGGRRQDEQGFFFEPTIITNVTKEMKVFKEEVFGPVAPIITFNSDGEAIELANDTPFGLGGSIWTKDLNKGKKLARELDCGSVFINSIVKSDPRMPFGGVKKSGLGRELAQFGLKEFVNIKGNNIYS